MLKKSTKNIINEKINNLTVISFAGYKPIGKSTRKFSWWTCRCDCGNIIDIPSNRLVNKKAICCGCKRKSKGCDTTSLIGKKINNLRIIDYVKTIKIKIKNRKSPYSQTVWKCQCDCGKIIELKRSNLISGNTKSCGCLLKANYDKLKNKGIQNNILPKGIAALNAYYGNYKYRAKKNKLCFELNKSEFENIIYKNCYFCGTEPNRQFPSNGKLKSRPYNGYIFINGIDRKDSSKGYYLDNCLPCCSVCNNAKSDLDINFFLDWIQKLKNHTINPL
jgi:hypothetical protein